MLNKDLNQYKMNFTRIYHNQVVPALEGMEGKRKRTQKLAIVISIIIFLLVAIIITFLTNLDFNIGTKENTFSLLFSFVFAGAAALAVYYMFKKNSEQKIKTIIRAERWRVKRFLPDYRKQLGELN